MYVFAGREHCLSALQQALESNSNKLSSLAVAGMQVIPFTVFLQSQYWHEYVQFPKTCLFCQRPILVSFFLVLLVSFDVECCQINCISDHQILWGISRLSFLTRHFFGPHAKWHHFPYNWFSRVLEYDRWTDRDDRAAVCYELC